MTFDLSIIFDIPECQYFAALRCHVAFAFKIRNHRALRCKQWCSGGGATGAIAPVPIFQGGAPLQFLFHLFLVNFAYIFQKLSFDLDY